MDGCFEVETIIVTKSDTRVHVAYIGDRFHVRDTIGVKDTEEDTTGILRVRVFRLLSRVAFPMTVLLVQVVLMQYLLY